MVVAVLAPAFYTASFWFAAVLDFPSELPILNAIKGATEARVFTLLRKRLV